jgi:predicted transcriptional regulator
MPCRYDPGPEDYLRDEKRKTEKLTKELDKLTRENDQLREALLNMINDKDYVLPAAVVKKVKTNQTKHRKEDLVRLEKTFREMIASGEGDAPELYENLGRVMTADPTEELEPQLGFNPDDF